MGTEPGEVVRLGLLGFGSVGRALAEVLLAEADWLRRDRGVVLVVTGVSTGRSGSRVDAEGLDLADLIAAAAHDHRHGPAVAPAEFAASCPADVIVETLPLEPFTGAVASEAIRAALASGRSVVSANKGPVAHALRELEDLAAAHGASYRYESAVADGMPVFNLVRHGLPAADVVGFRGVLNSTSSIVLSALAAGGTLVDGVVSAQAMGVAEADPAYDLDGLDAAVKLAALSAAVWGERLDLATVLREPVSQDIAERAIRAAGNGDRLVSVAELTRTPGGSNQAAVRLVEIGPDDVLYPLTGTSLGLTIRSRLLCPVTVSSSQPTVRDTAYGLLSDLLTLPTLPAG
jgi:homoserine dehydrogenase